MVGPRPVLPNPQGPSDVLDYNDTKTRASLAQTFAVKCDNADSCPAFTLVSNHFKSKGSDCEDLDDPDTDDGQVCSSSRPNHGEVDASRQVIAPAPRASFVSVDLAKEFVPAFVPRSSRAAGPDVALVSP